MSTPMHDTRTELTTWAQMGIAATAVVWFTATFVAFEQWRGVNDGEKLGIDALATLAPWFMGALGVTALSLLAVVADATRQPVKPGVPAWADKPAPPGDSTE